MIPSPLLEDRATYLNGYLSLQYNPKDEPFEVLSTIRYDPLLSNSPAELDQKCFLLFDEHLHRLQYTLKYFNGGVSPLEITPELFLFELRNAVILSNLLLSIPKKLRVLVGLLGSLRVEVYNIAEKSNLWKVLDDSEALESPIWDVFVDSKPTLISPFTSFKTTRRSHYSVARERLLPGLNPGHEEVLILDPDGRPIEGSITNIAVRKGTSKEWITPPLASGCLCGVARNYLLRQLLIKEGTLTLEDVKLGTEVLLFNGVMGAERGIVRKSI